ncbi:MAG TPA: hypothetical protein VH760_03495 [Gaiellaceae bacterium]|jgi:hypothetical protein
MGIWQRISSWWSKDEAERVAEATGAEEADPDAAVEDYESLKDDRSIGGSYIAGGMADYERDSEPPRP